MGDFFAKGNKPINGYGYIGSGEILLWENSSPASDFAAQTISFTSELDFDEFRILFSDTNNRTRYITAITKVNNAISSYVTLGTNGEINQYSRTITESKSGNTYSFVIDDCERRKRTNDGTNSSGTNNSTLIPYRIIGVIYNYTYQYGPIPKEKWSNPVSCSVGATSCTITDSAITTNSIIEDYSQNASGTKVNVPQITVTAGQAVLGFSALTEATDFKIHIIN